MIPPTPYDLVGGGGGGGGGGRAKYDLLVGKTRHLLMMNLITKDFISYQ